MRNIELHIVNINYSYRKQKAIKLYILNIDHLQSLTALHNYFNLLYDAHSHLFVFECLIIFGMVMYYLEHCKDNIIMLNINEIFV